MASLFCERKQQLSNFRLILFSAAVSNFSLHDTCAQPTSRGPTERRESREFMFPPFRRPAVLPTTYKRELLRSLCKCTTRANIRFLSLPL